MGLDMSAGASRDALRVVSPIPPDVPATLKNAMQLRLSSPRSERLTPGQRLALVCAPAVVPARPSGTNPHTASNPAHGKSHATDMVPGPYLIAETPPLPGVGTVLSRPDQTGGLLVQGKFRWPGSATGLPSREGCWVQAQEAVLVDAGPHWWAATKCGYSLAWVTLSDKGYRGQREDRAGPLIAELVGRSAGGPLELAFVQGFLLPDEPGRLRSLLTELALEQQFDLIVTTGGTGVAPRDTTPETTLAVIDKRLPGMETAMLQAAQQKTAHAVISRAVVGILGQALVINLPGSPKAVRENLEPLLPTLDHTLAKLQGDPSDCAAVHPLSVTIAP